ncbi:MAG: FAD-binding dehydrogenase [Rhodothermia bacterium]|nr:FAD-binding dehydrogenase [Rhodothermia bacterium]
MRVTALTYKTDVLIVGGGLAGIAAAIESLDRGLRVLIVDRDEPAAFGGLARWSFGGIFLVDSKEQRRLGIRDSVPLAYEDWVRTGEIPEGAELARSWARAYVDNCAIEVGEWLRKKDVRFFPVVHWVERGLYEPGNSVPRFHMVWGTGHRLVEALLHDLRRHANADRLEVRFQHKVTGLEVKNGRATGVRGHVEPGGTEYRVEAQSVVVAAGGYCGNEAWLRAHWDAELGPLPEVILNGSHRFATGDLHKETESAGGIVTDRERVWYYAAGVHHPAPRHPNHGLSIVPPKSALWLDKFGRRIGPEPLVSGFDTRHLVTSVCRSGGYSWQVMNHKIACRELAISGSEFNDAIRERKILGFLKTVLRGNARLVDRLTRECKDFVAADSPEVLAGRMNELTGSDDIDPSVLRDTIERYDARVERASRHMNDDQLRRIAHLRMYRGDRVRTSKSQRILDRSAMPLVAIREFVLSRKSLGGICTDLGSRVLAGDRDASKGDAGRVIPGLYAVGEAAGFGGGGIHGKRSLEGTFLGTCIFTGRIAAKSIAGGG